MSRPRPPKIDRDSLARAAEVADEIERFRNRLRQYEEQRKTGELPPTYIAFEALAALLGGRKQYTDEQLRRAWPAEWADKTIEVPFALVDVLASGWIAYKTAVVEGDKPTKERTLGKIMGLEGGGQGKAVKKQATRDKDRRIANAVECLYIASIAQGEPISLEKAFHDVADQNNQTFDAVKKAHDAFGGEVRRGLREKGIID